MKKKIPYSELNDIMIEQVKYGHRFILISKNGEEAAAVVSLEDLDLIEEYERIEDEMDLQAIEEIKNDDTVSWKEFNPNTNEFE